MEEQKFHFKGQNPGEEVMAFWRKHWIYILPNIIFFVIHLGFYLSLNVYLIIYGSIFDLPGFSVHVFITFLFLAHGHFFFNELIEYFQHLFILTSGRFIEVTQEKTDVVDFWTVQEIQKVQDNALKRFFNFGELDFLNVKVVTLVPDPTYYFDLLNKIRVGGKVEAGIVQDKLDTIETSQENPQKTTEEINAIEKDNSPLPTTSTSTSTYETVSPVPKEHTDP